MVDNRRSNMVVTEEIVKCWMRSDRPITHCLITGTLPKGTVTTSYVSDVLSELMSPHRSS